MARAWGVGLAGRNNGVVLFVFVAEHKLQIQVGTGLEHALTDSLCQRIIDHEIVPRFKADNYSGGLSAAVTSLIAATKGTYSGTGKTHKETKAFSDLPWKNIIILTLVILVVLYIFTRVSDSYSYDYYPRRRGFFYSRGWDSWNDRWSGGGGGWGSWGGGGSGGGFSGGGGGFGGGGAGGSW